MIGCRACIGALALCAVSCARAEHDEAATWPQWQAEPPRPAQHAAPPNAAPTHGLPSGVPGLKASAARLTDEIEPPAEPWAAWPVYGSVFHHLAHVFEAPRPDARPVGYFRRGAVLRLGEEVGRDGCPGGWHPVWGGGFVCRGQGYRLHAEAPGSDDPPAPNLLDPLPYRYVKVVARAAQTWRVPTVDEESAAQALLQELAETSVTTPAGDAGTDAGGPRADAGAVELPAWLRMSSVAGHYLSIAGETRRDDGKVFLRTVRGAYVPADATVEVTAPPAPGIWLSEGRSLPLAFAIRPARRFRVGVEGEWTAVGRLARGQAVALTDTYRRHRGRDYLLSREGLWVEAARLSVLRAVERPTLVPAGARWIHVDLAQQALVAYEGDRAVFATLVSSGKAGYETPAGLHRIHAKHVTTTMDDTALREGAYYIEDVPWTMYFQGSYALHAAFWHDRFGTARSHGCVNLAPADARALFAFLQPEVPGGRHGVLIPGPRASYVWVDDGGDPAS